MATYLSKIVEAKKAQLIIHEQNRSLEQVKELAKVQTRNVSFSKGILERNGIISEFKRRSPSKGAIAQDQNIQPADVLPLYAQAGVSAISVLTEEDFFGGSIEDLQKAAAAVPNTPLLRKDFIISPYQIYEARAFGASAILLIAAILTVEQTAEFAALANQLGLEVLLEIHEEAELRYVVPGVTVVGVNNRNLRTFEVDLQNSIRLSNMLPSSMPRIAESGIRNVEDMQLLKNEGGFNGFLIGETFMKTVNPGQACIDFCSRLDL